MIAPKITERSRALRNNMTDAKKLIWSKLRYDQLGVRVRRQVPVGPYIVDFFIPSHKIVIEIDGGHHSVEKDLEKTTYLQQGGYTILRYWNHDVLSNPEGVLEDIRGSLSPKALLSAPLPPREGEGGISREGNPWRADFPVLSHTMNGKPLVYLDSAASAQKPQVVIDTMRAVMEQNYSNIHRGLYQFSQNLTQNFEGVRTRIARFINAPSDQEIVFTRNTTEGFNLLAHSWGGEHLRAGDSILLTALEHHANIVPWQLLKCKKNINIKVLECFPDKENDQAIWRAALSDPSLKLVSVTALSNAIGNIININKISGLINEVNTSIKLFVDATQAVARHPVDVQEWGADAVCFTGHKLYGPTGIGVLWARGDLLRSMPPYQGGGDMIETVRFDGSTFKAPPHRFEAGTPAFIEVIGLGAAIDYVQLIGMDRVWAHEQDLVSYAWDRLSTIDGITIYGPPQGQIRAGIFTFSISGTHPSDIAMILDQQGIAVRSGHHCCMPLMEKMGVEGTVRASFGLYTTCNDIDSLAEGLRVARRMLCS